MFPVTEICHYDRRSTGFHLNAVDLCWLWIWLGQVVHAVVLLAHFHALSSFIHGCGITPEIDFDKGHIYLDPVNFNSWTPTSPANTPTSGVGSTGNSTSAGGSSSSSSTNNGSSNTNKSSGAGAMSADVMASMIAPGSDHHLHHAYHPAAPHQHSSPHHHHHTLNNVHVDPLSFTSNSQALALGSPLSGSTAESIIKNDKTEPETKIKSAASSNSNHHLSSNHHNNSTSKAGLLKNATHHNSLVSTPAGISTITASSPPKKGPLSGISEVDTIMATMKNLSETSPIEE